MASKKRARASKRPAKRHHHGDLRRAVIEASLLLITSEGVGGLSMREVARRVGVTHGAPYFHFADREEILAAIAEDGFRLLADSMRRACGQASPDPVEQFKTCGAAYIRFAVARPAFFRVMFRPELADPAKYPTLMVAAGEAFGVLVEIIMAGRAAGLAQHHDVQRLLLTSWSTAHGVASLWVDGPLSRGIVGIDPDPEALISAAVETLAHLLVAPGAGPKSARG